MNKNAVLIARVAGLFLAAALLAGCYAPITDPNGYLHFDLQFGEGARSGTNEVIGLVVKADYEDSFKELLFLIDKGDETGSLSGPETERLTTLALQMSTDGLVKFGGFPFFQTTMNPGGGSLEIMGIPAGRNYFVKLLVFQVGVSFKVEDIDASFGDLIQLENRVFDDNEDYPTPWQGWAPLTGQPVEVKAGESVTLSVTLVPRS